MTPQATARRGGSAPAGVAPAGVVPAGAAPPTSPPRRRWWPHVKRILTWAFFILVAWLLYNNAREIEWREVGHAVARLPAANLAVGVGIAIASYAVYSCYDLISRAYVGFRLGSARVVLTTFISYAFNLNLGSLVGGMGFRFRLYSRQGVEDADITRTIAFSMWTNWFGYITLAGVLFLFHPIELPADWRLSAGSLRILGAALLVGAGAYLVACALSRRRKWTVRGHDFELPPLRMAAVQLVVAATNWLLIGAIVWTLLQFRVDYTKTLTVLLVAAVAGVITHVPAGVGVLEAVFVSLLGSDLPKNEILGALLAYRAVYYLGPLVVATIAYVAFEGRIGAAKALPPPASPARGPLPGSR
ncbi:MAG: lysylphosphatidylglycerol synthase domain-containing protein [Burkholderiaceae bacterium]